MTPVKRFTAKTSREALRLVREALGDDAVVLSTKPAASGIEVMAMAPESLGRLEQLATPTPVATPAAKAAPLREEDLATTSAEQDAERLAMSTLSFQDYVRKRMLKRREAALKSAEPSRAPTLTPTLSREREREREKGRETEQIEVDDDLSNDLPSSPPLPLAGEGRGRGGAFEPPAASPTSGPGLQAGPRTASEGRREATVDTFEDPFAPIDPPREAALLTELRAVKDLIEERFGALAFMERLQRRPAEARLAQKLLDCGFSPMLVRKIADAFKADAGDETGWAAQVLERNLRTAEAGDAIEERDGVFALIGATGVGKTTTTAKIAAAFAARQGAASLGLITLDAYRVGAHEQLRAYGRILGVPVHTAHDRASLEDLLELLSAKKMVLIDTAGMAQRDSRTRELLDMLSHRSVQRLLVVSAAAQGETIEDVLIAYRAATCAGMVLSKIDEAVKLGPALDAAIRHRLQIAGVANGQRVPEDWHRLSSSALVQRALRGGGSAAWRLDAGEMNLVFSGGRAQAPAGAMA